MVRDRRVHHQSRGLAKEWGSPNRGRERARRVARQRRTDIRNLPGSSLGLGDGESISVQHLWCCCPWPVVYLLSAYLFLPRHQSLNPIVLNSWTEDEQELLEKYLLEFPPEEFSSVLRYVKISAKIQKKCAREVALRIRWMRANGLPVDGVSSFVNAGGFIGADQGVMEGMGPGLPLQSPSSSSGGGGGGVGGSGVAGVGAGDRGGDQPPGAYASSYGSSFEEIKAYASARSGALMGENITFLGKIRKNLTEGRYDENLITMAKLRSNVAMLVGLFGSLPVQMPPLDVVLDTSTLSMERAMQQQQLRLRK